MTRAERTYQDAAHYLLDNAWRQDGDDPGLWQLWREIGWMDIGSALILQWERDGVSMLSTVEAKVSEAPVPGASGTAALRHTHEVPAAQVLVKRLCALQATVAASIDPRRERPADCFCATDGYWPLKRVEDYRNDGHAVDFIVSATRKALGLEGGTTMDAKRPSPDPGSGTPHTGFGDCACDDCWPPDAVGVSGGTPQTAKPSLPDIDVDFPYPTGAGTSRVGRLEEALRAAADTFGELALTFDITHRPMMADTFRIAEADARAALAGGTPPPGEGDAGGRGFPASSGAAPTQTTEEKR